MLQKKEYCLIEGFPADKVICATSRSLWGNMSLAYGHTKESLDNRREFLAGLNIGYKDLICAGQVHGSSIAYVTQKDRGRGALEPATALNGIDALVTDVKKLPLSVFTADCPPVFLYDPNRPAAGLVHAGWRGTRIGILTETLRLMEKIFSTQPQSLKAAFGPSIRSCCYKVGKEFSEFFSEGLFKKGTDYYLDLAAVNTRQLLNYGVVQDNIFDCGLCTFHRREEFFSYRREGESCGRMMSVAMLL